MTRTVGHLFVLGLIGALTNGSTIPVQWAEGRKGQTPGVKPLRPLAQISPQTLKTDYALEPQSGTQVAVGLAISGGGTRAAMFAHGVLQGLNDKGYSPSSTSCRPRLVSGVWCLVVAMQRCGITPSGWSRKEPAQPKAACSTSASSLVAGGARRRRS